MSNSVQIAVEIFSALLTGGFLLFFIETMHIESDVKQRFKSIMNPFYHKLSKMAVYVGYMRSTITFPQSEWGKRLKGDMDYIHRVGIVPSSSGCDIPYMSGKELDKACEIINDIWYCLEKSPDLRKDLVIHGGFGIDIAAKALCEVYEKYKGAQMDVNTLHESAGNFYTDYWQPVEHCTQNYEYWQKKAKLSRALIFCALGVSLLSLIVTMLWADCFCPVIPCSLAILSSIIFSVCIGLMAYLMSLSNRLFRAA